MRIRPQRARVNARALYAKRPERLSSKRSEAEAQTEPDGALRRRTSWCSCCVIIIKFDGVDTDALG